MPRWFEILKKVELMSENEASTQMEAFTRAVERGYPSVITPLTLVAKVKDGKVLGFTSFSDMGKFFFVGSSLVSPEARGTGIYGEVIRYRDTQTGGKPRITLIGAKKPEHIATVSKVIERNNGVKVNSYEQVRDIMDESTYNQMRVLPMYRYDALGGSQDVEKVAGAVTTSSAAHSHLFKPTYGGRRKRKKKKED